MCVYRTKLDILNSRHTSFDGAKRPPYFGMLIKNQTRHKGNNFIFKFTHDELFSMQPFSEIFHYLTNY